MSALDRAFIRAYHRPATRTEAPVAAPTEASTAVVAPAVATNAVLPLSQALADLAAGPAEPVSTSIGALLDEAIRPEEPQNSTAAEVIPAENASLADNCPSTVATEANRATTSAQFLPPPARDVTTGSVAAENNWSPLLQVDRVVWPAIHNRLQSAAQTAIAAMTDALQAIGDSGRKRIGLASCARGEGVTTLVSAAARHFLQRGRKVVLIDSHWGNPQLAKCLGLLPQIGWEESLAGGLPLEEIVIESLADGLAVLPVREPPASAVTNAAVSASLEILARNYDVVLVDLGTMDEIEDGSSPARHVAACMDALVLVQSVRTTPPHHLSEVRKRLAASEMRYAGTIENFVAG